MKKKATGFNDRKAFSWETDLWVTLGDFTGKTRKIGKGNLYLTENQLSRNEVWCASDNHNSMCCICAKESLDLNFNFDILQLFTKYQFLTKNINF